MSNEEDVKKISEHKPIINRIRCPNCNSAFTYIGLRNKILICRSCGTKTLLANLKEGGN